jgi:hypothetical protein
MADLIIGGASFWLGLVMFFDRNGLGTRWRSIGFHYYDQHDASAHRYQRRTRLFRSYYLLVAFFGILLLVIGTCELL